MASAVNYKNTIASVLLVNLVIPGFVIAAEKNTSLNETATVNTSKWKCKYCPDNADEPWFLEIETGLGFVTNDSYKFGEYNGFNEKGAFLILDVDAMFRDEDANYFDIKAENLGLDTRRLEMEGGTQGKYKIKILVDQINRYNLDTSRTPYSGSSVQTLPVGWVDGATTSGMTNLSTALHNIHYSTQRNNINVSGNFIQNEKWSYDVKFKHQTKEGNTPFAAAIGSSFATANSAVLAKPVDYTTDIFELSANYKHNNVNGSISFINSTFKNKNQALTWENAFTTGTGSDFGKIALEPDNEMQQLMLNGQYRGFEDIIISGLISIAKLTQNQTFVPYTNNGSLAPPALPKNSLDGNVDVINANVNVNWTVNEKSKIKFSVEHQEQSNATDRATYTYVTADSIVTGSPRANFPYSFQTQKIKVNSSYRLENNNKVSGGIEYGLFDRTYQEVDSSTQTSIWAKYSKKLASDTNYSFKLLSSTRKADSYDVLAELIRAENTQLRKYNLADNNELKAAFNINFLATDKLFMNINIDQSNTDYTNSSVGLTQSDDISIAVDAQYSVNDEISLTAYIQQSTITSTQNGSKVTGNPDWTAENKDTILTIGIGSSYTIIEDEFNIGFDLVHTDATGEITLSGVSATPLPDLTSKRNTITLYGDYAYDENMTFKLSYKYEEYQEKNWNLDTVTQGTIDNVLSLGETSPDYSIGVVWVSMKYIF